MRLLLTFSMLFGTTLAARALTLRECLKHFSLAFLNKPVAQDLQGTEGDREQLKALAERLGFTQVSPDLFRRSGFLLSYRGGRPVVLLKHWQRWDYFKPKYKLVGVSSYRNRRFRGAALVFQTPDGEKALGVSSNSDATWGLSRTRRVSRSELPGQFRTAGYQQLADSIFVRRSSPGEENRIRRSDKGAYDYAVELDDDRVAGVYRSFEDVDLETSDLLAIHERPQAATPQWTVRENSLLEVTRGSQRFYLSSDGRVVPIVELAPGNLKLSEETPPSISVVPQPLESEQAIANKTHIEGQEISALERRMESDKFARSGMLARGERLKPVLIADRNTVASADLTHTALAEPLAMMHNGLLRLGDEQPRRSCFIWKGKEFDVQWRRYNGAVVSPFTVENPGDSEMIITDVSTGETILVPTLVIRMIKDYGFYEGNVPYRVDPAVLIRMFYPERIKK